MKEEKKGMGIEDQRKRSFIPSILTLFKDLTIKPNRTERKSTRRKRKKEIMKKEKGERMRERSSTKERMEWKGQKDQ